MSVRNERGFTLPELLVVIVVAIGLLAVSILMIQPEDYANKNLDAKRQLHIATIAQALGKYRDKNGAFPEGIPTQAMEIGSVEDSYDLCKTLVPAFLKEMPLNPTVALTVKGTEAQPELDNEPCTNAEKSQYLSGYLIEKTKDGHIEVRAEASTGEQLVASVY